MPLRTLLLSLLGLAVAGPALARDYRITLPAAETARSGQVIRFKLPADAPAKPALQDAQRQRLPLQRDDSGHGLFVVPFQPAGQPLVFTLVDGGGDGSEPKVHTRRRGPALEVTLEGKPLFSYWVEPRPLPRPEIDPVFLRAGFIHPVFTPSGVEVTDSYAQGHLHHHGIWSPWTKTEFQGRSPDFWNMGQRRGTVEVEALDRHWSGPVAGGFVARHRFVDLTAEEPVVALHETWEVAAYASTDAGRPARVFDLVITQTCATDDPLILPEYHYGGLGYRGHAQWNGADRATFLTSEGLTDRLKAHGTRARWCHVGGDVDGKPAGTAILGHPENFRAPQPMRIHPNEPFFCYAPAQLGEWQIKPGEPYVARYRFVVMDGEADPELLESYWSGYANPAAPKVEPL